MGCCESKTEHENTSMVKTEHTGTEIKTTPTTNMAGGSHGKT